MKLSLHPDCSTSLCFTQKRYAGVVQYGRSSILMNDLLFEDQCPVHYNRKQTVWLSSEESLTFFALTSNYKHTVKIYGLFR